MTHLGSTYITRTNLYKALEEASPEFVSDEAKRELYRWAYDVIRFTVGDWDNCPLDQVGLVEKFRTRRQYREEENTRFKHEASELDARILNYVVSHYVGEVTKLEVSVVDQMDKLVHTSEGKLKVQDPFTEVGIRGYYTTELGMYFWIVTQESKKATEMLAILLNQKYPNQAYVGWADRFTARSVRQIKVVKSSISYPRKELIRMEKGHLHYFEVPELP